MGHNRRIVILSTLAGALLWTTIFLFFGRLHGMWPMFHDDYFFVLMRLFPLHGQSPSFLTATLFAFGDGAVFGVLIGLVLKLLLKKLPLFFTRGYE